ncbi:MAG: WecB/TagA/CpsF family glycosyltransferase [Candidatus Kryptoniota bacterium]
MSEIILSVRIDSLDLKGVISKITQFLTERVHSENKERLHQISTVNPEFIMTAQKDPDFLETLNSADLNVADGVGLQLAAKILGINIGARITGVDLTWELAKLASENGYSIFFLGAAEGVAEKAAHRLKASYPTLRIAGVYSGTPYETGIVERVNNSKADILLVAFGAPKQDKFIFANKGRLKMKVAMGVGGTFDYIAGTVPYAPNWMRQLGLEWLYRLINQPQRINRIITATIIFPMAVLISKFSRQSKSNHKIIA